MERLSLSILLFSANIVVNLKKTHEADIQVKSDNDEILHGVYETKRLKRETVSLRELYLQHLSLEDNTLATMFSTVAIGELKITIESLNQSCGALTELAKQIKSINNTLNSYGYLLLIFFLFFFAFPVLCWIFISLLVWKVVSNNWRAVVVPLAMAKNCEVTGNFVNFKDEIVAVPRYEDCLNYRFEDVTQSESDSESEAAFALCKSDLADHRLEDQTQSLTASTEITYTPLSSEELFSHSVEGSLSSPRNTSTKPSTHKEEAKTSTWPSGSDDKKNVKNLRKNQKPEVGGEYGSSKTDYEEKRSSRQKSSKRRTVLSV